MRTSHVAWNLLGLAIPLVVAAFTVPSLVSSLGADRFGFLALAWGMIGYAGAIDLGIGRALTQRVSRLRGNGDLGEIPGVLATASAITLGTGLVGAGVIVAAAAFGIGEVVATAATPVEEITSALLLLAIAFPAQAMAATYKGLNEAFLHFKGINVLRIVLGVLNFGGPFVVSLFTSNLSWLVSTLVVSRVTSLAVYHWLAHECIRKAGQRVGASYSPSIAKSLFSFGGWIAISSTVSPMLVQADRFVIASVISAAAVTTYVVPYEVVVQSLILVGAISSVVFPTLSQMMGDGTDRWRPYFKRWLFAVCGSMLVICTALACILPTLLRAWLGKDVDPVSILVGQILCLGVFANSIGSMFYALLHAKGRPDITAKLHLLELPLFLMLLILFLSEAGVVGAAWAWVARMIFDAASLGIFAWRHRA